MEKPESSDPRERATAEIVDAMQRLVAGAVLRNELIARRLDLNVVDLQALGLVLRGEATTPGELAARSGLPTSTATRIVDRLEQRGLLRRSPDPSDRRRVLIELVGDPFASLGEDPYAGILRGMREVHQGFSPDELALVARYLVAMTALGE